MRCSERTFSTRIRIALASLLLAAMPMAAAKADEGCMPYAGERLVYDVGWEFINAGTADMRISGDAARWRIDVFARTNRFLDLFKKVRDTIHAEGRCVNGRMQSEVFDIEQHERRYHAKKQTRFDWRRGKVRYTQNGKTDEYDVPAGYLHVLDAFLSARRRALKPGDSFRLPVFDSRKTYEVTVKVQSRIRRRVKAPWGAYVDCLVLEPRLKTEGIFSSTGKIWIWVTNDARHIPLRVVASIKIGHIVAVLQEYHGA